MMDVRRAISTASMLAGLLLFVAGLGVRAGAIPISAEGKPLPAPSDGVAVVPPSPGPSVTALIGDPTAAAPAVSPSARTVEPWFADDFDAVAAWPDGKLAWVTTSIMDGRYRIDATETDLPVVLMAAGEEAPGPSIRVTVELSVRGGSDPAAAAGIALDDANGTRLLALVSADGRVSLLRDSVESLDVLALGSVAGPRGQFELTLALEGDLAAVSLDGTQVASARTTLVTAGVGLGVWAVGGPATVDVDRYRVWTGP